MPAITPVTAGAEINKAYVTRISKQDEASKMALASEKSGYLPQDTLEISQRARDRQQQTELNAQSEINQIAKEVIRVSSSIGKAKSTGNLTTEQAAQLYKEIAALL